MSFVDQEKMDDLVRRDGGDWQGIDKTTDDPEEARVMFCALDSFLSVSCLIFSTTAFSIRTLPLLLLVLLFCTSLIRLHQLFSMGPGPAQVPGLLILQ